MSYYESNVWEIIGFHLPTEPHGCFSNWFRSPFTYAGIQYNCVEQYMMAQKVALGRRLDLLGEIMDTDDPARMKALAGKECFPEFKNIKTMWDNNCLHIVKRGVKAKFRQNPEMLQELMDTGDALLCECSRQDRIWGIGINLNDDSWEYVRNWKGNNYLGIALMEVREELRREDDVSYTDFRDANEITEWTRSAEQLKRIPQYYKAIHAYADQLSIGNVRNCFYGGVLFEIEEAMRINQGGGLPVAGFYEMKQEVYEIAKSLRGESFQRDIIRNNRRAEIKKALYQGDHITFDRLSEEYIAIYGISAFSGFDAPTIGEIVS